MDQHEKLCAFHRAEREAGTLGAPADGKTFSCPDLPLHLPYEQYSDRTLFVQHVVNYAIDRLHRTRGVAVSTIVPDGVLSPLMCRAFAALDAAGYSYSQAVVELYGKKYECIVPDISLAPWSWQAAFGSGCQPAARRVPVPLHRPTVPAHSTTPVRAVVPHGVFGASGVGAPAIVRGPVRMMSPMPTSVPTERGHYQVGVTFYEKGELSALGFSLDDYSAVVWDQPDATIAEARNVADDMLTKWWTRRPVWWPKRVAFPLASNMCADAFILFVKHPGDSYIWRKSQCMGQRPTGWAAIRFGVE